WGVGGPRRGPGADVGDALRGVLGGGGWGPPPPGPGGLGGDLLFRRAHQFGDLPVAHGVDLGDGHAGQALSQSRTGVAGPAAGLGHGRYLLALTGRGGMAWKTIRSPAAAGLPASSSIRPAAAAPMMNRPSPVSITRMALAAA